jgi:hypothetical protein
MNFYAKPSPRPSPIRWARGKVIERLSVRASNPSSTSKADSICSKRADSCSLAHRMGEGRGEGPLQNLFNQRADCQSAKQSRGGTTLRYTEGEVNL